MFTLIGAQGVLRISSEGLTKFDLFAYNPVKEFQVLGNWDIVRHEDEGDALGGIVEADESLCRRRAGPASGGIDLEAQV